MEKTGLFNSSVFGTLSKIELKNPDLAGPASAFAGVVNEARFNQLIQGINNRFPVKFRAVTKLLEAWKCFECIVVSGNVRESDQNCLSRSGPCALTVRPRYCRIAHLTRSPGSPSTRGTNHCRCEGQGKATRENRTIELLSLESICLRVPYCCHLPRCLATTFFSIFPDRQKAYIFTAFWSARFLKERQSLHLFFG